MSRPRTRFVPVKSVEQQAARCCLGPREQLVRRRTQLSNVIRGHAAEFGLVVPQGLAWIEPLLLRLPARLGAGAGEGAVRDAGRGIPRGLHALSPP